jgi:hypothetical protein
MTTTTYTLCGHPVWSDAACQTCDGCRDARAVVREVMSAAQYVVATWENQPSMLEPALEELRDTLDGTKAVARIRSA